MSQTQTTEKDVKPTETERVAPGSIKESQKGVEPKASEPTDITKQQTTTLPSVKEGTLPEPTQQTKPTHELGQQTEPTKKEDSGSEHEKKKQELDDFLSLLRSLQDRLQEIDEAFTARLAHIRTTFVGEITSVRTRAQQSETALDSGLPH